MTEKEIRITVYGHTAMAIMDWLSSDQVTSPEVVAALKKSIESFQNAAKALAESSIP